MILAILWMLLTDEAPDELVASIKEGPHQRMLIEFYLAKR